MGWATEYLKLAGEQDQEDPALTKMDRLKLLGLGTAVGVGASPLNIAGAALAGGIPQYALHPDDVRATQSTLKTRASPMGALPKGALNTMQETLGVSPTYSQAGDELAGLHPALRGRRIRSLQSGAGLGHVSSDASAPDLIAHELGHVSRTGAIPGTLGHVAYNLDSIGSYAPLAAVADPSHGTAYGLVGSAMSLPKLYEEGRASVQAMRALSAASKGMDPAARRSLLLRSGLRLGGAGSTYLASAALPAVTGWAMQHYADTLRKRHAAESAAA